MGEAGWGRATCAAHYTLHRGASLLEHLDRDAGVEMLSAFFRGSCREPAAPWLRSSGGIMPDDQSPDTSGPERCDDATRERIVRLAFDGDRARFDAFMDALRTAIPPDVTIILRGSAVTGQRWADGQPFDADGPGTSDLDLTLVGGDMLKLFRLGAMYIPALHSAPLDDRIPDAAPALVPLRRALSTLAGRPVNIQATTSLVQYARDVLFEQPYAVLLDAAEREAEREAWQQEIERRRAQIDWAEWAREHAARQAADGARATVADETPRPGDAEP